jgi:phosphomannomutase
MALALNPTIFRAYDIRGVVDVDLDEAIYHRLGLAVGTIFSAQGRRTAVVGRDARLSSPRFQAALISGLRAAGIDVIDIGQVPTPLMYFAVEYLGVDGGAIVSASHNPPEYNGLKLRRSHPTFGSEPLTSADIQEVAQVAVHGVFTAGAGTLEEADVSAAYVASCARLLPFSGRRLRVVVDGGNGVAGPLAMRTYAALGLDAIPLFIEPDGTFPNHHPDPLKAENLQDLIRVVREQGADIGIGLDGDGDRLGIVDSDGTIVFADRYLIALATYLLGRRKGPVIFDVKCSAILPEAIRSLGGEPIMWKTGYSSISAKMRETNAVLGGELSGHTFSTYPGHYFDDGAFAGAHLLFALSQLGQSLQELLAAYPNLPSIDEGRIPCDEALKFKVIDAVRDHFARDYKVIDVDGVRVDFGDGWGLVRASNTEPAITTRFEAQTLERAQAIRDQMLDVVKAFRAGV